MSNGDHGSFIHNRQQRRAVISATIGNALEWFDIIVFGFFAITISKLFFPTGDDLSSLLLTAATFGVSFVARPVGAIVLGMYADRAGRKAALSLSMLLMTLGTLTIGLMPTYASIGFWAPLLVVTARLIQGFSAGGEFGSSTTFLLEHTHESQRGFFASWQVASQGLTALLAAVFGMLIAWLPAEDQLSWGWRIPFLFGALIGPVGLYIRNHVEESPEYSAQASATQAVAKVSFWRGLLGLLPATGLIVLCTIGSYMLLLYMPTYAIRQLHLPAELSFYSVMVAGLVQLCLAPYFGGLSDRIGATRVMMPAAIFILLAIYPAFAFLVATPSVERMILVQLVMGVALTAYFAPVPALLGRLFSTRSRAAGLSISYSLAVTVFGGFAPFIATWLIGVTGDSLSPAWYISFGAALSIAALISCRAVASRSSVIGQVHNA